jgi:HK97 family phage prohead protease
VSLRPDTLRFAGYAALFDRRDAGRDTIRPGAFAATLAARREPLPLYWQHRADQRIGWIEAVGEDARGLRVVARIDNPEGAAALALRRGTVTGLSFGYRARDSSRDPAGRELIAVDLFEVSLVTHPMQHGARVHLFLPGKGRGTAPRSGGVEGHTR